MKQKSLKKNEGFIYIDDERNNEEKFRDIMFEKYFIKTKQ
jgi:hypothetical protein